MVTSRWCAGWLLLFRLLKITNCASDQSMTCMALESGGVRPTDKQIEIQKNSYINLTVFFQKTSNCQNNDQDTIYIKISKAEKNVLEDLCKFLLKTDCQTSDSTNSTSCQCLSSHIVQFVKKASSSDSGAYSWILYHGKTQNNQVQREDIFISVKETASTSDDTAAPTATITVTGVSVGVVVIVSAGLVLLMRCKRRTGRVTTAITQIVSGCTANDNYTWVEKWFRPWTNAQACGQHHCSTEIEDAGNDHVNQQGTNQVEDTYYTEINESDEPTYAKVNKEVKWY